MNLLKRIHLLLAGMLMVAAFGADAQQKKDASNEQKLDVEAVYQAMNSNPVSGSNFWMQGATVQVHDQFWRGLGVVGAFSALHNGNINDSTVGLDLNVFTVGPRYTLKCPHGPWTVYGQVLAGEAWGRNSVFPALDAPTSKANSLALTVGGGVSYGLRPRISLRLLQTDWLRTQLPNATTGVQNNLRLGAGVVVRLK